MYPVMRSKQVKRLPENILQDVKKNTLAMMIYKLAVVIVAGTDNLIISKFLGTIWVGLYSNYSMIFSSIQTICSKMITAVTSTIGNVIADGDTERSYKVFEAMQYICFWIYGICSIELFILSSSFVALFFGHEYLIPTSTILVVSINFYLLGMQGGTSVFRDAQGIFWQGKLRPLLQGVLNLVISIVLVKWMGNLTAVFLGTVISRVLTITWFDPYVIHKYGFKDMSKIKIFIKKYVRYIILTIVAGIVAFLLSSLYSGNSIGGLIYRMLVSAIIVFAVFLGFTFKTQEFNFLYEIVKNMLKKNKR